MVIFLISGLWVIEINKYTIKVNTGTDNINKKIFFILIKFIIQK